MVHIKNRAIADFLIIVFMKCRYFIFLRKVTKLIFFACVLFLILTDKMKFGFMR